MSREGLVLNDTGRLLVAHEAVVPFGIGAEIAATVAREAFWDLDAPIERIGAAATPPPYAPELERAWLPGRDEIAAAVRREVQAVDPAQPIYAVQTMNLVIENTVRDKNANTTLLTVFAGVSLLLALIGVYGVMSYTVAQHTREIGIRMSVGARGHDILLQFLIEAVTLSAVGGVLGILLGIGSSYLVTAKMNWPTRTSPDWMILAFVFSAAVGIFFGFYPARKASQLDPIESLRYE